MRPITVSVGPLAAASANNIATSQTPAAGTVVVLNGTLVSKTFQGTGSIAGNTLTISGVTSGVVSIGDLISGAGVKPNTYVMGPISPTTNGTGTYVVSVSQTVSSTTIYSNAVATLDTPRRVLLTPGGNESSNTFTLTGTGWGGDVITEVLAGGNAVATYTVMDFATVTQIVATNTAAAALTIGTNGVASSAWVRFDEYALPQVAIQASVTGTVSYTIQQSVQPESAVVNPYQVTWVNSADPNVVNATASMQSNYSALPVRAKVTLNSGTGSVSATFSQAGIVPY